MFMEFVDLFPVKRIIFYTQIIKSFSTIQCQLSKNGPTHNNNFTLNVAGVVYCECDHFSTVDIRLKRLCFVILNDFPYGIHLRCQVSELIGRPLWRSIFNDYNLQYRAANQSLKILLHKSFANLKSESYCLHMLISEVFPLLHHKEAKSLCNF